MTCSQQTTIPGCGRGCCVNCSPGGGTALDPGFVVDFHDRPGGTARTHEMRLQDVDCTSEIFQ